MPELERKRSEWFNNLPEGDRRNVESIIVDAVNEALFGLLSVLDGARAIEDSGDKGQLVLTHKGVKENLLNDPDKIGLHDLYNGT